MKRTTAAMINKTTTSDMKKISARHKPMCSKVTNFRIKSTVEIILYFVSVTFGKLKFFIGSR